MKRFAAVFSIAFTISGLITAELLPVSVLTPMASDLSVSEGLAGQSLTATAFVAIFASLVMTRVTKGIDRRIVVIAMTAVMIASNVIVAAAPNFVALMVGRLLLGISLGGFWSMAASLTMRLVDERDVPRALSIVFGGVSVSLVVAAPIGTMLESAFSWRAAFWFAAALGAIALVWQWRSIPKLPPQESSSGIWAVTKRPGVAMAMLCVFLSFAGQFAFFTYMRPFLEQQAHTDVNELTTLLLIFGVANFVGTSLSSRVLGENLVTTLMLAPFSLVVWALALKFFATSPISAGVLLIPWGLSFSVVPVGWSTWITRNVADDAENAGGLQVATIQLANSAGAAIGGFALENFGVASPLIVAAVVLFVAGALAWKFVPRGAT
ncbi:MAG: MFS transporter [Archangium sp.]